VRIFSVSALSRPALRSKDRLVAQNVQACFAPSGVNRRKGTLKELFYMKRLFAFVLALASGMVLSAAAQAPAAASAEHAGPTKIAVIDFQQTVARTNEFQRNLGDLQKKFDPRRVQLKTLNDQIESLTKQLQAQAATLSEADRASRASAIDTKKKQLDRDAQDAQSDFEQQMQETFNGVATKVLDVMTAYAEQHGYAIVLDASQQSQTVLFSTDSANISKTVLDAYNLKSGVPAPPPGSAAPAPRTSPAASH
jgi:outer membrane protein